jgi:NAD(P)-dependent dehydrogenase (short-subunit alcohol dehydrogenase family)
MGRLSGKVAIVTGAASRGAGVGNGAATAILFAREGAKVVLVNRDAERAAALEADIRAEAGEAVAFAADVTQPDAAVDLGDWERVFRTNLTSALLCCRACIPRMRAGGGGSIINVSSTAGAVGLQGATGAVAYVATKSGLQGMTLSLAADYAAEGIRANCLIVGTVATPMVAHLGEAGRERRRQAVPLQTEGTGWDVGWAAVYLASDESRWVTGVMLPIDGGFLAIRAWPR